MATVAENLNTSVTQLVQQIADITANPRPTYQLDGQSVSWTEYLRFLTDSLEVVEKARQRAGAPFWTRSQGRG